MQLLFTRKTDIYLKLSAAGVDYNGCGFFLINIYEFNSRLPIEAIANILVTESARRARRMKLIMPGKIGYVGVYKMYKN